MLDSLIDIKIFLGQIENLNKKNTPKAYSQGGFFILL
jgi:hypothetical protein